MWCSQAHFYPRRSQTLSKTDWQEVSYRSPRPKLSIPTSCIPRKEVSYRYGDGDGERLSLTHHIPQHAAGSTQPILDTFRACFAINFCKWIIESLSWIRSYDNAQNKNVTRIYLTVPSSLQNHCNAIATVNDFWRKQFNLVGTILPKLKKIKRKDLYNGMYFVYMQNAPNASHSFTNASKFSPNF